VTQPGHGSNRLEKERARTINMRRAMTITVAAVYEDGVLKPKTAVNLPERAEVRLTIEAEAPARTPLGRDLLALRAQAVAEGAALLDREGILEEVRSLRGGCRE
jgi:predicted DNA-binding antitoxin AbrB/MazE fold protein